MNLEALGAAVGAVQRNETAAGVTYEAWVERYLSVFASLLPSIVRLVNTKWIEDEVERRNSGADLILGLHGADSLIKWHRGESPEATARETLQSVGLTAPSEVKPPPLKD